MSSVANTQSIKSKTNKRSPDVVLRLSRDERKSLFSFIKLHVKKVKEVLRDAAKVAAKEAKEASKVAAKEAKEAAKVAAKEAKEATKVATKEAAKAAKEAERAEKKAVAKAAKEAERAVKKARGDAERECVRRLSANEKIELADRYLLSVVPEANLDDIDAAVKKIKTTEWRAIVALNWDEVGVPSNYATKFGIE